MTARCSGTVSSKTASSRFISRRSGSDRQSGFLKSFQPQLAGIAATAGVSFGRWIVATVGEREVDAQAGALADDFRFREMKERSADFKTRAVNTGFGRERRQIFKRAQEFRPAIRITAVVDRIHAEKNISAVEDLGPRERIGKEDGIARGNVGDGNSWLISSADHPCGTAISSVSAEPPKTRRSICATRCACAPSDAATCRAESISMR